MSALVEVLAKVICAERYDCAEAAGWATCDHGFGYRDAKPLAAVILDHLRAVAADEGVRERVADAVPLGWTERDPYRDIYEAADAALAAFLGALAADEDRPKVTTPETGVQRSTEPHSDPGAPHMTCRPTDAGYLLDGEHEESERA